MIVELKPELEAMIQRRLESGAFSTAEEVIERALEFLAAEEDWLVAERSGIADCIEAGWNEAQTEMLLDEHQVRAEMQEFKRNWLENARR